MVQRTKRQIAHARILVVESDPDARFLLDRALCRQGYQVDTYSDGLKILDQNLALPDLIVLECDLPIINGVAMTKFLRINKSTQNVPIIMLSSHSMRTKAMQVGVDKFIRKPFALKDFMDVVNQNLQRQAFKAVNQLPNLSCGKWQKAGVTMTPAFFVFNVR